MWASGMTIFLCICLVIAWIVRVIESKKKNQKMNAFMASTPGPIAVPVIGCIREISSFMFTTSQTLLGRLLDQMKRWDKKRGAYWILDRPYLFTSDPLILKAILDSSKHVNKTDDYDQLRLHATGIITAKGAVWHKTRRTINPAFRTSVLWSDAHVKNYDYHAQNFLNILTEHARKNEKFDMLDIMYTLDLDIVCDNLLGYRVDMLKKNQLFYAQNMRKSSEILNERFFRILSWPDLIFYLTGEKKMVTDAARPMRDLVSQILEEKLKQRVESRSADVTATALDGPKNFMDIILNNIESGDLTKQQGIEECVELYLAGTLTTGTITCWVFKILAMRPDIQQKVYEEIVEICGREVKLQDVSKLVYLDMVINETLRHFSVPFITRRIEEDVKLEDGTTLPAGLNILFVLYDLHHNPEYWVKPGEFFPEHFSPANSLNRPKGVFLPFSSGPRSCPGGKSGMTSMKYLIANTLLRFEFSADEKMPDDFRTVNYLVLFLLCPVSGFEVKVRERMINIESTSSSRSVG